MCSANAVIEASADCGFSCALLDIHRPDLIDFDKLDQRDHRGNMKLAFDIASKEIGIPDLLDVEDVCDVTKPDERSLMTYIAYWFHAFSQMERVENAGRRVEKFVSNMQGAWGMQNSFEKRMRELLREIREQRHAWERATFTGSYTDAKDQSSRFVAYKKSDKRKWVGEKSELTALLGNIRTKMGTYRLRPWEPPHELSLDVLEQEWSLLLSSEREHCRIINETIRESVSHPLPERHTKTPIVSRTPCVAPLPTKPTILPSRLILYPLLYPASKATWMISIHMFSA